MKLMNDKDRYQFQPWYVKLWRNRHEMMVPWYAIKAWLKQIKKPETDPMRLTFKQCWSICKGIADGCKGHYYTWDEVKREKRIKKEGTDKLEITSSDIKAAMLSKMYEIHGLMQGLKEMDSGNEIIVNGGELLLDELMDLLETPDAEIQQKETTEKGKTDERNGKFICS